ncbi:MAG: hypothetical protein HGB34_02085 [Candidatus Moranbacteria bacterium]|nr:hypothetical protein [Candidatus Moranbacteria bacterium]NTW75667.1 hypothetical protein [Candidatus Moranbacteria bacterium]
MKSLQVFSDKKRSIFTGSFIFLTMLLYVLFPAESRLNPTLQSIVLGVALFVLLPILYVKLVLREPLSTLGFRGSVRTFGLLSIPLSVIPLLSVWYVLLRTFPVAEAYHIPAAISGSFVMFLSYEVLLVGSISFLYEVFFRGAVQLLWLRESVLPAVFAQVALFVTFMAVSGGGLFWSDASLILAAFASGFVASYTRSISYAWASAWLMIFLSDVFVLLSR